MNKHAGSALAPRPLTKAHRQGMIRAFLRRAPSRSQAEMLLRLRGAGVRVTQSTLSRDLRDLGLVKDPRGYREADRADAAADPESRLRDLQRMVRAYLNEVSQAGTLVVLKTSPGLAHALGVALDRAALPEIAGTVAGDDTVFAAAPDPSRARALVHRVRGLIGRR